MKNAYQKGKAIALLAILAVSIPASVSAFGFGSETAFGGLQVFVIDSSVCNCPDGGATNIHYIMDYASNSELKLYDDGSGTFYDDANSVDTPFTYQLGSYAKGEQECMMDMGEACITIDTADGTYGTQPGTGFSSGGLISRKDDLFGELFTPLVASLTHTNEKA